MKLYARLAPIAVACATLMIGACAQQQTRDSSPETDAPPRRATTTRPVEPAAAPTPPAAAAPVTGSRTATPTAPSSTTDSGAQFTGIAVCDEYLATYRACNSVITTFTITQIDDNLAALRSTWQADARDPDKRAALEQNCRNLTTLRDEALDDRDCELRESDFVEPDRTDFENVEGDSTLSND